ncbi:Uncharacterized protein TCAP_06203 [Tolypocladium capitatum]|uniref:WW domain-containing protein n=1 Tax=Tolypocladium capitatum TaxID=45235 RepID=A0A2K3Q8I5_9HYPO|nr:Uncharacterized protein TCAP_06203 [Tolypocladium capitatum]
MTSPRSPAAANAAAVVAVAPTSESRSPEPVEAGALDVKAEGATAEDGASPDVSKEASAGTDDAARGTETEAATQAEDTEAKIEPQAKNQDETEDVPPLPNEGISDGPPLPEEPTPESEDDGWEAQLEPYSGRWYFANRFTGVTQWENPRVPEATNAAAGAVVPGAPPAPLNERPAAGGYNPAIHGDYDPNAWYAQAYNQEQEAQEAAAAAALQPSAGIGATVGFDQYTGPFQAPGAGPNRHSDEAKSHRQMNAFFDVDAAANAHDGRSLKAERQNKRLSKTELKAYKEKRRAKKEEKRRAWLMD